jgi:hypothetical protein
MFVATWALSLRFESRHDKGIMLKECLNIQTYFFRSEYEKMSLNIYNWIYIFKVGILQGFKGSNWVSWNYWKGFEMYIFKVRSFFYLKI